MPDHSSPLASFTGQYDAQGRQIITARGELDLASLPPLTHALTLAAVTGTPVILDLEAVTFADSTALSLFLATHQATALHLAAPGHLLRRLLEVTGTDQVLNLHPTLDDARTATA
ncbi:STAS domain-containing protein [Streptomyces sp. NPDC004111]|uniref:STAS domain-containing protein n=1 Tax=Streptomyces sp. NPDC004111 TaxID=3364690 RepID=UPI0036C08260